MYARLRYTKLTDTKTSIDTMKKALTAILLTIAAACATAQTYSFTFKLEGLTDTMLYIVRHHRDRLVKVDSCRAQRSTYRFEGRRQWERGVYSLVGQDGKKRIGDFVVDASRRFTIAADAKMTAASVKVKGCPSNEAMFKYLAVEDAAQSEADEIAARKKDPATREQAERDDEALTERMLAFETEARHPAKPNIFFTLVNLCDSPEVPDSVTEKGVYYRRHYWDALFDTKDASGTRAFDTYRTALLYSPQLFSKMNYFFYGMLYYADSDTICAEIDRLAARIGDDTAMLRYVFDHIEPRYFRSTKNVGWDAVWCHLASEYYLKGRCPWATEGTIHNMRYNYNRLRQSLIGAPGQELWMADTNQSSNPADWISSHRFPTRYVILWFWDPDCHHCQEQSAELKVLYDSLQAAGNHRFEVYAIGYESDVEKWKRYVREHDFRWVNVGGTNVNIDYQEAYNVHGAPTMIILNERRDIIMNKVLPAKSIMQFLDNYEKRSKGVKE